MNVRRVVRRWLSGLRHSSERMFIKIYNCRGPLAATRANVYVSLSFFILAVNMGGARGWWGVYGDSCSLLCTFTDMRGRASQGEGKQQTSELPPLRPPGCFGFFFPAKQTLDSGPFDPPRPQPQPRVTLKTQSVKQVFWWTGCALEGDHNNLHELSSSCVFSLSNFSHERPCNQCLSPRSRMRAPRLFPCVRSLSIWHSRTPSHTSRGAPGGSAHPPTPNNPGSRPPTLPSPGFITPPMSPSQTFWLQVVSCVFECFL